jgi:hypothetical protein
VRSYQENNLTNLLFFGYARSFVRSCEHSSCALFYVCARLAILKWIKPYSGQPALSPAGNAGASWILLPRLPQGVIMPHLKAHRQDNHVTIAKVSLRQWLLLLALLCTLLFIIRGYVVQSQSAQVFPGSTWQTRTPAEVGLDAAKLNQFVANISGGAPSSGVIIRDGYLVMAWGNAAQRFDWASAAKPVHSTLLMFALQEGLISNVDDPVGSWGWNMSAADQNLSFRHLANNISGYARLETPEQAWAYNDYGISLYAKTLTRVFGTNLNTAALQRLAPLQFQDGSLYSSRNGYGLFTSPRDYARIGWLWLNRGNWNGQQLLPASYFDQYMRPQVSGSLPRTTASDADYLNVGTVGGGSDQTAYGPGIYGFNWWFNAPVGTSGSLTWPDAPADTFQANGHWNVEIMTIIPSLRMVIAANGNWGTFMPGNATASMNRNLLLLAQAAAGTPPTNTPTALPPTATPTSLAPTNTPTALPPSATPTAAGFPRTLPSSSAQVTFTETQPPLGNTIYIRAEIATTQPITNVAWYVNGALVNTERAAPYYLGGDTNGTAHGYALTVSSATVRALVRLQGGATIEAQTDYPPTGAPTATPPPPPTSTPTALPPSATPTTAGFPRTLPSSSAQVTFIETQSPLGNTIYIRAEIATTQPITNVAWYVNGALVNTERAAPYYLGGDTSGTAHGYALTVSSATIRALVTLGNGATIEAQTDYPPAAASSLPAPTATATSPALAIAQPILPNPAQRIESDALQVERSAGWMAMTQPPGAGMGSYLVNTTSQEIMAVRFQGVEAGIVYLQGPSFGSFVIEVDGQVLQNVETYAPDTLTNVVFTVSGLSDGEHVLRVLPASGVVAIDAFVLSIPSDFSMTSTSVPVVTMIVSAAPTSALPTETPLLVPTAVIPTSTPVVVPTPLPLLPPTGDTLDDSAADWTATSGWALAPQAAANGGTLGWQLQALASLPESLMLNRQIDLRGILTPARPILSFYSLLAAGLSSAAVQVSADGANWQTAQAVTASAAWTPVEVDLSAYNGQLIQVRFVWQGSPAASAEAQVLWLLDRLAVLLAQPQPSSTPTATDIPSATPAATITPVLPTAAIIPATPTPTETPAAVLVEENTAVPPYPTLPPV